MSVTETLSPAIPTEIEEMTRRLLQEACARELKLVTAESCTGGLLASLLTDVAGCSHAFERGFVVYTNEAKHELLGVGMELLDSFGAVSAEVARAMAEGALAQSRGDIAISITGFAGKAGKGNEDGLVHFACARHKRETMHRVEHFGNRGRGPIRIASIRTALEMMQEMIR